jgi:DNA invertase Pin-like site-specific DNA recombinase
MTSTTALPAILRAGLYGRQSHGKATSVEDQDRANETAATEHGWTIAARYSDLVSASRFGTKKRSDWAQLVDDVAAARIDVVVLWDTARGDPAPWRPGRPS